MRFMIKSLLTAASTASNQTSADIDATFVTQASIQATATGTPTGAVTIQASNDGTNYVTLTTPASISVSAAGSQITVPFDVCTSHLRAVYTGSGTGTITVIIKTTGF